jgi:hypothetical protein
VELDHQNKGFRITSALFVSITLLLLAYWTFEDNHEKHYACDFSPKEAQAKNCQFDMLAFAWVPRQCFDAELASTWNTYHDFDFFYDEEKNHQITVEELKKGINYRVFTSGRYHRSHYVYAWQTLQRAVIQGKRLSDNKTLSLDHHEHCSYFLININDSCPARFDMDFLYCDRVSSGGGPLFW